MMSAEPRHVTERSIKEYREFHPVRGHHYVYQREARRLVGVGGGVYQLRYPALNSPKLIGESFFRGGQS